MRTAVINNCRNKIVFNPVGSDDTTRIASMLPGINKTELESLGRYRAALQTPDETQQEDAIIIDTYPPYTTDTDTQEIKQQAKPQDTPQQAPTPSSTSLGDTANAGGKKHAELLKKAKKELEDRGLQVNLLYQDQGDDKPDGHIVLDDEVLHLEAEHTTLTKPAKVLQNLRRAHEKDRETIFAVEHSKAQKLENILEDPVNRRGKTHQDQHGTYDHYTDTNGQPVTDTEQLQNAEYRILEITEDGGKEHEPVDAPECPELSENEREELENFCLYRDQDGHCTELEQPCVLLDE